MKKYYFYTNRSIIDLRYTSYPTFILMNYKSAGLFSPSRIFIQIVNYYNALFTEDKINFKK